MLPLAHVPFLATCFLSNGVDFQSSKHDAISRPRHLHQQRVSVVPVRVVPVVSGLTRPQASTVAGDLPLAAPAAPTIVTSDYVNPIVATTSIDLPFSSHIAYDAFSDLVRQPSWSPWLESVRYLDDEESRTSLWTMKIVGLSYSWKSISTYQERPSVIEWESTSGLRNRGRVDIQPSSADPSKCGEECRMTLTMVFQAPLVVAALFRNDFTALRKTMEDRILSKTLSNFRDVVLTNDLKHSPEFHEEKVRDSGVLFPH